LFRSDRATIGAVAGSLGVTAASEERFVDGYDEFMASRGPALLRTVYLICGGSRRATR